MIKEKQKEVYTSPTTDALEILSESMICQSYGANGAAGGDPGLNDDNYNFGSF